MTYLRMLCIIVGVLLISLIIYDAFLNSDSFREVSGIVEDTSDVIVKGGTCTENPSIAILTWCDSEIDAYSRLTWRINCAYGKYHGIDVIRSNIRRDSRHAMWQRVKMMMQYLPQYDYVVWCDADAAFNFRGQSLRAFITSFSPSPDVILSEDIDSSWNPDEGKLSSLPYAELKECNVNSGVVLIRNCTSGRRFLEEWDRSEGYTNDQNAVRYIYHTSRVGLRPEFGRVVLVPYGVLQCFTYSIEDILPLQKISPNPLIFHLAGSTKDIRVEFFSQLLPVSVQALDQSLVYMHHLDSTNKYDQELHREFRDSWRRVDEPDLADVHVLIMSNERNYPNFVAEDNPGMTLDLKAYASKLSDQSGASLLTLDLCSQFELPDNAINVSFSSARETDIVILPPALHGRRASLIQKEEQRDILSSFKGARSRAISRTGRDVRALSYNALASLHDGIEVIVCDADDPSYDYDDLLDRSIFAFILEGDQPWTYRLTEAVLRGCVPLFIQEDFSILPHRDLVEWDEMCIRLPLARASEARTVARSNLKNVARMRSSLQCYVTHRLQSRALEVEAILETYSLRYCVSARVKVLSTLLCDFPTIPKKIHITWKNKDILADPLAARFKIVQHGVLALKNLNPSWSLEVSDDADLEAYLQEKLSSEDYELIRNKKIVEKSDLWRLLKVYHEGGCYSDLDRLHNCSLDDILNPEAKIILPTWEDINCSQDIIISSPGSELLRHAIELNLEGRRKFNDLYSLGPPTYWRAASQFILGFPILHEKASPLIFSKLRSILDSCPYTQTFREQAPSETFTYRGPAVNLDKSDFYEYSSVTHWTT